MLFNVEYFQSSIKDLLSSTQHSDDFNQTRNSFITARLRLMCLIYAFAVPASALFDLFLFGQTLAYELLSGRLALAAGLLVIYFLSKIKTNLILTKLLLTITFLLPTLFYINLEHQITSSGNSLPFSVSVMPYLIITMLGLFPLTVRAGITLLLTISLPICLYSVITDVLLFHQMWVLTLFGGVALWLQLGQLSMLMKLYRESTVDPLTGLINRRVLMRQLHKLNTRGAPYCLMILDLDRFKRINDNYGHHVGDQVLLSVAKVLKTQIRRSDIAARFGGEEFIVVLPNTEITQSKLVAQNIADAISMREITAPNGDVIHVTTSIGLCQHCGTIEALLNRADELLYQAKSSGRNQIKF